MARVRIHRIPAWASGGVGIKVVVDGQLEAQKLTLRKPNLDLELPPGPHTFVFRQWIGGSQPLHIELRKSAGILIWANPENGPGLLRKKNSDQWVYAREASTAEIREARAEGGTTAAAPTQGTIATIVLWLIVIGAMSAPITAGGKTVALVCAVGMTSICAWQWSIHLGRRR